MSYRVIKVELLIWPCYSWRKQYGACYWMVNLPHLFLFPTRRRREQGAVASNIYIMWCVLKITKLQISFLISWWASHHEHHRRAPLASPPPLLAVPPSPASGGSTNAADPGCEPRRLAGDGGLDTPVPLLQHPEQRHIGMSSIQLKRLQQLTSLCLLEHTYVQLCRMAPSCSSSPWCRTDTSPPSKVAALP
jgi:hypothetical protein